MARLIGLFGNRSDLIGRIAGHEARVLDVRGIRGRRTLRGWGVGFHQGGEVLLRKRPSEERSDLHIEELVQGVQADSVLVQVRADADDDETQRREGGADNTHPFRYRSWLYAQTGVLGSPGARARLLESVPQFLQSQIRGESDAEVVFSLFLSFLHDANGLEQASVEPEVALRALRSSLSLVDNVLAEFGKGTAQLNLLLGNGEMLLGVHRGRAMAWREYSTRADLAALFGADSEAGRRDFSQAKMVVVASDFQVAAPTDSAEFEAVDADALAGWRSVEPGSVVVLTRRAPLRIEPL